MIKEKKECHVTNLMLQDFLVLLLKDKIDYTNDAFLKLDHHFSQEMVHVYESKLRKEKT
jgi:hypothetical protein